MLYLKFVHPRNQLQQNGYRNMMLPSLVMNSDFASVHKMVKATMRKRRVVKSWCGVLFLTLPVASDFHQSQRCMVIPGIHGGDSGNINVTLSNLLLQLNNAQPYVGALIIKEMLSWSVIEHVLNIFGRLLDSPPSRQISKVLQIQV